MADEKLVKSRQRVADHGEVFTPRWLVDDMLDLVKSETERIDSRFLEPAFMRKSGVSRDSGRSAINSGGLGAHDSGGKPSGFYDNSGVARSAAAAATARAVTAVASR